MRASARYFVVAACAVGGLLLGTPRALACGPCPPAIKVSGPLTAPTVSRAVHPIPIDVRASGGLESVTVSFDGRLVRNYGSQPSPFIVDAGPYDASPTGPFAPGPHTVTIGAVAEVEGGRASRTLSFTIAGTPPDIEIGGDLVEDDDGDLTGDTYDFWVDGDISSAGATSGVGKLEVLADGVRVAYLEQPCTATPCDADLSWDFLRENFTIGRHTITARVTDIAGSMSTQSVTVNLSADRTPDPPDDESPGTASFAGASQSGSSAGCAPLASRLAPTGVADVIHAQSALVRETTVDLLDGTYVAVRCDALGNLLRAQRVGPVPTPEGMRMLILSETTPGTRAGEYLTSFPLYGSPTSPRVTAGWPVHRRQILSSVLPRTRAGVLHP
jgi:hypothetical protein